MRLLQETLSKEEALEDWEENSDKKFAAMGNARTIQTVSLIHYFFLYSPSPQIVSSMESSKEILVQLQEILVPMILATLENQALGE